MSRNFELLQQAEKEREAGLLSEVQYHPPTAREEAPPIEKNAAEVAAVESIEFSLQMDDASREEIAKLVQRVFLLSDGAKALVFAAVEASNGCTWMVARAAQILAAQANRPVCMIDANFCSPSLHNAFSIENHYGLTDSLLEPGPIRKFTRNLSQNLWLLSFGSMVSNGRSLIQTELIRERIAQLRQEFPYILIDAPPIGAFCSDVIAMGRLADAVALVVEADSTRRELARKAVQDLVSADVRLAGAVLNKRSFPIPEALYRRL